MNLPQLGWRPFFEVHFERYAGQGLAPARVVLEQRERYAVLGDDGELAAEVAGKMRHESRSRADFPTVGDWVAISPRPNEGQATIHARLPRASSFSRKAVLSGGMPDTGGKTDEQVLAANIDTVFLVSGLDSDFNVRRIERYLSVAWDSGATPVIVLNKADLCDDVQTRFDEVASAAVGVSIHAVSAIGRAGLEELRQYLTAGQTAAFLGSSGVGKSTIINSLLGEERLETREVREHDGRGRHTTTHRQMIFLKEGGIVIDTPGMREIQMWSDEDGLSRTFGDVEHLSARCRFRDCRHQNEPGCAVRQALEEGELDARRFDNYLKMQKELAHLARRRNKKAEREVCRAFDKKIRRYHQEMKKLRDKGLA
ncbi:MAG: ribosome small subunit-dependent GTPase A [candidate division Zixibacteria bacterium]|nr:ribosome small subunit-dependent GTPase A [candidate division Zixibacteria bacterium]